MTGKQRKVQELFQIKGDQNTWLLNTMHNPDLAPELGKKNCYEGYC